MLRRLIAAAVALCCLLPANAAAGYRDVIRDCVNNGELTKKYTQKEYRDALARMSTDAAEYYGCRDIIKRAQVRASNGADRDSTPNTSAATGGGGGGGSTQAPPPTPDEQTGAQRDIDVARRSGAEGQNVADVDVRPGALAYRDFGSVSKLPTPLTVFGLLLLGAALAACAYLIRGRVRARHAGA